MIFVLRIIEENCLVLLNFFSYFAGNKNNSFCNKMMSILDLDLLTDPIYVHIIIGLSLVYTCNIGFSMLFPFFLHEKFDLKYTAICMSISSGADIMARLTIPLIANNFHLGNRMTFLIGASVLALCRSCKQFA